ncbi:hypothetical protein [Maridesulfovibrio hydrothermalis]|uniref:Uncharacterized protein n=1 Tax=Maridesulfovibrio hydrothermalis AM13 = DSM 14728 TaxID=1121451 RepID=L0RDR1_9BACT|nr:hypothetical protein [Maridesulfovibrio hydrothermalis]CCO24357.1 conserved protein of unknown function [Maridesulfovibrio hydrothermalis AM13 = DSM 14728]
MILPGMAKDNVTLVKANGERFEGLKAVVNLRRIVTFNTDVKMESKDLIIKHLADGGQEAYLLLDVVLNKAEDGIPENYQIAVRKVAVPE